MITVCNVSLGMHIDSAKDIVRTPPLDKRRAIPELISEGTSSDGLSYMSFARPDELGIYVSIMYLPSNGKVEICIGRECAIEGECFESGAEVPLLYRHGKTVKRSDKKTDIVTNSGVLTIFHTIELICVSFGIFAKDAPDCSSGFCAP